MLGTSSEPQESSSAATPEPVWALIDARTSGGVDATTRLGGLSLIARQVRMAARRKWAGALIQVADAAERSAIEAALAAEPPPPELAVEYAVGGDLPDGDARTLVLMRAAAIYTADELEAAAARGGDAQPAVRIDGPDDLKPAERTLVRLIRKSIDQDGVVSYFCFRPISRQMTRLLIETPVSPNHVSIAAMLFGIAAAICAGVGGYTMVAVAGILYWVGAVVDCVDGELARLRLQGSKMGEWLDTLADDVSTYGLMAGLGIGLWSGGADPWWAWIGIGGAGLGFLLQAKLYADLHAWGMTIDTAQYPWFFGTPSEGTAGRRGAFGWFTYLIGFVFRRDAFVTIIGVVLVAGQPRAAVIGLAVGLAFFTGVFITDAVVNTVRGGQHGKRSPMKWSIGYFGVKDLFTIVNLAGGVMGIYFAFQGRLDWAGYAIFTGYLLGDALDGPVARLTNTSNRFGGEFDSAADHIAQAIAPAVILYAAFTMGGHRNLGVGLMGLFIATASIRQARFNVAHFDYPLTYCGLPRTISGLIAISFPNSNLFFKNSIINYEAAAAILAFVAILNLCPVPYMTHKGKRPMQLYVKIAVFIFLLSPPVLVFVAPQFVYDFIFFITFGYALSAWIPLYPQERREFWAEYKRWSHEVATLR